MYCTFSELEPNRAYVACNGSNVKGKRVLLPFLCWKYNKSDYTRLFGRLGVTDALRCKVTDVLRCKVSS